MAKGSLGAVTNSLIGEARLAKKQEKALTKEQRLLLVMKDGERHKGSELAYRVSWRFGGCLHSLKRKGVEWEKRRDPKCPKGENWYDYRLVAEKGDGKQ